ncbi:MAG: 30S ribosomal protein S19 [bacterium]|nr:30S ribosomal protein S19 [bacterium]
MARSIKKGSYTHYSILEKIGRLRAGDKTVIKTWSRSSTIIPEMIGYRFGVHNGRTFTELLVTEDHVGHKLGEFSPTRKFTRHGGRMAKDQADSTKTGNRTE